MSRRAASGAGEYFATRASTARVNSPSWNAAKHMTSACDPMLMWEPLGRQGRCRGAYVLPAM